MFSVFVDCFAKVVSYVFAGYILVLFAPLLLSCSRNSLFKCLFASVVVAGLIVENPVFGGFKKAEVKTHLLVFIYAKITINIVILFLIKEHNMYRIGNGYDVHALAEGLSLWICGVKVAHTKGCVAHSDGDAPLHALCDAMLGALALGDIGKHFPDTSAEFKGIDSKILLRRVNQIIGKEGYKIVNADITVVLERPKIAPYIDQMRETIATTLECPLSAVSVKATTSERIGFVGREEGIVSYATVLLERT